MTAPTSITQVMMERAIRAAKKNGCVAVEVRKDAVRIIVNQPESVPVSPQLSGDNTCDGLFGVSD